ncbi:HAD-IIIC family phosphatase [Adlercreutzia murintestinalis]|jgi:HAD-superfamily phosphatase, subfamily IIIC/FkbH-like domain|uniref:HAD-IIIC family phosphatase n=1 Tax=Adlercreutzia murintestinalis TaxID=2941325 RepID=UPI002041BF25|nr:HAD-IIIC family phosphatase [Adlercreutzia murintestinalis]
MANRFLQIKKSKRRDRTGFKSVRMAVMGDCATQHLAEVLEGVGAEHSLDIEVFDADYDQIDALVLDRASELYAFSADCILIQNCVEKLYDRYLEYPSEKRGLFCEEVVGLMRSRWKRIGDTSRAMIIQTNYPEMDDRVFGDFANEVPGSFISQLRRINVGLMDAAAASSKVRILDVCQIQSTMGRDCFFDPKLYCTSKIPCSLEALCSIGESAIRTVRAMLGEMKKCVIVDLDNTMWGGVIGDDGLSGIEIGDLGIGAAFVSLQKWLKELKGRGILLAVCSKNDLETAQEPFEKHDEMVLKLDDFAAFVANWEDKASNIKAIQKELNIGMDSLVFIDDNPFERNAVRSLLPDVVVPELPDDPACYLPYLQFCDLFTANAYSIEDKNRTELYAAERSRRIAESQYQSYEDYLEGLCMIAAVEPFDEMSIPRVAQLTQRSNQFNLRTIRYSEAEISAIAASDDYLTAAFTLSDRFGDHGLIALVILEKRGLDELFIDSLIMSCRVLKRGMEEFVMNKIVDLAREHGFGRLVGEYIETKKNKMVAELYNNMGFTQSDGTYELLLADYAEKSTYIQEEENGDR